METDGQSDWVQEQLHAIERGEPASWVVCPPTPWWWAVGFGCWSAALALVIGVLDGAAQAFTQLGLIVILGLMTVWDRRRRGTCPRGRPPREFNRAILRLVLEATVVGGLAWLAGEQVGVWPAAAVAGVGSWAVVSRYEHAYAAIAARLRERPR